MPLSCCSRARSARASNLRAVWANYIQAGVDRLVIATMLRSSDYLQGVRDSTPGGTFTICLLRVSASTTEARLTRRHLGSDLEGHVRDSASYAAFLESAAFEDFAVKNEACEVPQIAAAIIQRIGWL